MTNDENRIGDGRHRWLRGLLVVAVMLIQHSARAQTGIKIQLVSEVTAITPGQPFYVGLFIRHEPGYHTYWKQPGIVGVPTQVQWELPAGFEAGDLEYPEPESVLMFRIKAQGYERDVLLQARITPPADLKPGGRVTLAGNAAWMACARTCHPDNRKLTLELPVAPTSPPDPRWQPLFDKERATFARSSDAWEARAVENDLEMTLHLSAKTQNARAFASPDEARKIIFFTEDGWIHSDQPQQVTLNSDGSVSIRLTRADVFLGNGTPEKLLGIVQHDAGWLKNGKPRSLRIAPLIERPGKDGS